MVRYLIALSLTLMLFATPVSAEVDIWGETTNTLSYITGDDENPPVLGLGLTLIDELRLSLSAGVGDAGIYSQLAYADDGTGAYLDLLYLDYSTKKMDFRIGKQLIAWGRGLSWNPTDNLTLLDYRHFQKKLPVTALKIDYYLNNDMTITTVLLPPSAEIGSPTPSESEDVGYALKFTGYFKDMDISGSIYRDQLERRYVYGLDGFGAISGIGVRAEVALSYPDEGESYTQFLVGADYTFENGLHIIGEYHRDEKVIKGAVNRLIAGVDYDFTEKLLFLGALLIDLDTGNFAPMPDLTYCVSDELEIKAGGRPAMIGDEVDMLDIDLTDLSIDFYVMTRYSF